VTTNVPHALLAGQVGKPHGIAGEVYVFPISDDPARWRPGSKLLHESAGPVVIATARPHRDRLLVRFEGVESRAAAEALRGALYIRRAQLRSLEPGEYWDHDLAGCKVIDVAGAEVGEISRVVPGPAQDLLAVRTPRGERLVPAVAEIVQDVDVAAGRVTIDPPAGLLD
jgi:16S rRNA processing protein RimM